jgi:hypothetical protein
MCTTFITRKSFWNYAVKVSSVEIVFLNKWENYIIERIKFQFYEYNSVAMYDITEINTKRS